LQTSLKLNMIWVMQLVLVQRLQCLMWTTVVRCVTMTTSTSRAVILPLTLVCPQFTVQFSIYNLVGKLVSAE
jgi:hypothetical protein